MSLHTVKTSKLKKIENYQKLKQNLPSIKCAQSHLWCQIKINYAF